MNPTNKIQLINDIALHLKAGYNTTGINMLLSGYNIPPANDSIVSSKRAYVIDLLKSQPNELIIRIANDLGLAVPEQIEMQIIKEKPTALGEQKIFISHSRLDIKIVEKVIDILEAIGVPSNKIFCSSL